jgi:hypothetical protein
LLPDDAVTLFQRLGIDVRSISAKEFTAANQQTHELMANINAARTAILKCRRVA